MQYNNKTKYVMFVWWFQVTLCLLQVIICLTIHHSAFDETPGSRAVVITVNLPRPLCDDITVPFYWAVWSGCSQPAAPSLQVWCFLHCTWPARSPAQGWWASLSLLTLLMERSRINCYLSDDPFSSYGALQNYWSSHQPQLFFLSMLIYKHYHALT